MSTPPINAPDKRYGCLNGTPVLGFHHWKKTRVINAFLRTLQVHHLPFILTDQQRAPNQQRIKDDFRDEVIAHVRTKAVFVPEIPDDVYQKIALFHYQRVDEFLRNYDTATYESYVRMMFVYIMRGTEQVEGPQMQPTLRNEHFGINTRVQLAYELCKRFMKEGI